MVTLSLHSIHSLLVYILLMFFGTVLHSGRDLGCVSGPEQCLFIVHDNKHLWREGVDNYFLRPKPLTKRKKLRLLFVQVTIVSEYDFLLGGGLG